MLLQMRTFSRSWVAYLLLFVLAAMFVLFLGNGQSLLDTLQTTGSSQLAQGRGVVVRPEQLTRELELTLRAQRNEGNVMTQQEAIQRGMHLRLLDAIIGRAAMYAYADKIGVSASDSQVAARIREIPAVLNPVTQTFDTEAYANFLNELRYTQPAFETDVRSDLTTRMLMQSLMSGVRAPSSFGAVALIYESETRVVSLAEAPASVVGAVPPPSEPQMQTFWEESQEQLRVPEYRALTLVFARIQDFVTRVEVSEERLREELEARGAALAQPERRTYVRISAQNEQQANDAAARLARGETAEAIAAALGVQATRGENQGRTEVPDARVADTVFSMSVRDAPRVVRAQLSPWAVVRLISITPAAAADLTVMRAELRQALAMEEATELLNTAIGAFEDARAGGSAIADAARQNGLTVLTIAAVDAQGRGQNGAPIETLEGQDDILTTAFETPEGEAGDFLPIDEADVIVSVDRIIPTTVRPLAEVRTELAQIWVGRERARRLRELGDAVVTAVQGGQSFAAAARAHRMNVVVSSRAVDRRAAAQIPARGLAAQLFAGREGAVVSDMRADNAAVLVGIVERINRVDPATAPQLVEASRVQMQESIAGSLGDAIQSEIVERAEVRKNERRIQQVYGGASEDGEGDQ